MSPKHKGVPVIICFLLLINIKPKKISVVRAKANKGRIRINLKVKKRKNSGEPNQNTCKMLSNADWLPICIVIDGVKKQNSSTSKAMQMMVTKKSFFINFSTE